ncbi:MAG: c-type cytochrome [Kineosporiaceae bacterium]
MTAPTARRRRPLARAALLLTGLLVTGAAYTAVAPGASSATAPGAKDIAAGHDLFLANCATCHGVHAEGRANAPSLIGVGAAAVDFQVGTGRMPMQASGPQAPRGTAQFSQAQIDQLAAYVASLSPGPDVPSATAVDPGTGDPARGALIFRTNCAMCHNVSGKGGALTRGKYAPNLTDVNPRHAYEAMLTGPESMPVFNDQTLDPQSKRDVLAYLDSIGNSPSPGGFSLGGLGPVSEGLLAWTLGLALLVSAAVWVGAKAS